MVYIAIVVIIAISLLAYEVHNVHWAMKQEVKKSKKLYEENGKLKEELEDRKDRVKELSESIEHDYGIKTEINRTFVDLEFSPYERVVMTNALAVAMAKSDNVDTIRSQMELLDKLVKIFTEADNAGNRRLDDKTS